MPESLWLFKHFVTIALFLLKIKVYTVITVVTRFERGFRKYLVTMFSFCISFFFLSSHKNDILWKAHVSEINDWNSVCSDEVRTIYKRCNVFTNCFVQKWTKSLETGGTDGSWDWEEKGALMFRNVSPFLNKQKKKYTEVQDYSLFESESHGRGFAGSDGFGSLRFFFKFLFTDSCHIKPIKKRNQNLLKTKTSLIFSRFQQI